MCRKTCHNCDSMSTSPDAARVRAPYIRADDARRRILDAARALVRERPFAELSVRAVMAQAGLTRTIFYRYFDDLPALAADLLPDADDPLLAQVERTQSDEELLAAMIDGLVATYAEHGPLLRAIDDAARHDPAVAAQLETALAGPRALLGRLVAGAPHPPPDPEEFARLLMATHRAYLLDQFGAGAADAAAQERARAALHALWERLRD
jgi:TetR/AcrR family transcriptional regulator, ethionamide resistance regulator